ncbi:MAG: molecular chaperone HtpG, partial [Deltaproteobacteria bacterium]|nr:molecular chaperone HtpG [Deltaproteobacteria bacterium]
IDTLCEWIKETLGESVNDVSVSKRLVDSPVIALNADKVMTPSMRRMMKAMKQDMNTQNSVNLEINPAHELIKNLSALKDKDADTAKLVTEQILDNALIAAGYLEDPREMVSRVYKILERVSQK